MNDLLEIFNFFNILSTKNAVQNTETILYQSEVVRQNDNIKLDALVNLYAKAREHINQNHILDALLVLSTEKKYYTNLFANTSSAEIKLKMTEVDEKAETLINNLFSNIDNEKNIVVQLSAILIDFCNNLSDSLRICIDRINSLKNKLDNKADYSKKDELAKLNIFLSDIDQVEQQIVNEEKRLRNLAASIGIYIDPRFGDFMGNNSNRWNQIVQESITQASFNSQTSTDNFTKIQNVYSSLLESKNKYQRIRDSLSRKIQNVEERNRDIEERADRRQLFIIAAIVTIILILILFIIPNFR